MPFENLIIILYTYTHFPNEIFMENCLIAFHQQFAQALGSCRRMENAQDVS